MRLIAGRIATIELRAHADVNTELLTNDMHAPYERSVDVELWHEQLPHLG